MLTHVAFNEYGGLNDGGVDLALGAHRIKFMGRQFHMNFFVDDGLSRSQLLSE